MGPGFGDPYLPAPMPEPDPDGPVPDDELDQNPRRPQAAASFAKVALVIYAANADSIMVAERIQSQIAAAGGRVEIRPTSKAPNRSGAPAGPT